MISRLYFVCVTVEHSQKIKTTAHSAMCCLNVCQGWNEIDVLRFISLFHSIHHMCFNCILVYYHLVIMEMTSNY